MFEKQTAKTQQDVKHDYRRRLAQLSVDYLCFVHGDQGNPVM